MRGIRISFFAGARVLRRSLACAFLALAACRSGTEVDDGGETPASVRITVPATLVIGDTLRVTAIALNRGGRSLSSVVPAITVSFAGRSVRALDAGTALALDTGSVTITAVTGTVRAEQRVTIAMPSSLSLTLTAPDSVSVGDSVQIPLAEVRRDNVVRGDLSARVTSSDTAILRVVHDGNRTVLRPLAAGRATLTAALGARIVTRNVTVIPPRLTSFAFSLTPTVADVGDKAAVSIAAFDVLGGVVPAQDATISIVSGPARLDGAGRVEATAPGRVIVRAALRDLVAFDTLDVMPPSQLTITIRPGAFSDGTTSAITPKLQRALDRAVKRWRQVIRDDLPAAPLVLEANRCRNPAINKTVQGVLIHVRMAPLGANGPLAGANACVLRADARPILGMMEFNSDVLDGLADEELFSIATHELGHVLGIASLWYRADGIPSLVSRSGTTGIFIGPRALAEFDLLENRFSYTGPAVPLARDGGHWDSRVLQFELMEPFARATTRFSRLTVGAMADMGYVVNARSWDRYAMPLLTISGARTARAFDLSGDVLPPYGVVQADGRVIPLR